MSKNGRTSNIEKLAALGERDGIPKEKLLPRLKKTPAKKLRRFRKEAEQLATEAQPQSN